MDLISGSGRSPGGGNGNPLQNSCLGKSHGQRSLEGYRPWSYKAKRNWASESTHTQNTWVEYTFLGLLSFWGMKKIHSKVSNLWIPIPKTLFPLHHLPFCRGPWKFYKITRLGNRMFGLLFPPSCLARGNGLATGDLSCFNCIIRIINGFSGGKWLPWDLELDLE